MQTEEQQGQLFACRLRVVVPQLPQAWEGPPTHSVSVSGGSSSRHPKMFLLINGNIHLFFQILYYP